MTHLRTPSAFPKNRAADPYMGRAELDREFEIGAHAHRERQNPIARGDLVQKREMRRGLIVDGWNAHEARNFEAVVLAAACDEGVRHLRQDTRLLRLGACIDLDIKAG